MFKIVILLLLVCVNAASSSLYKRVLEDSMIEMMKDEAKKDETFRQTVVKTLVKFEKEIVTSVSNQIKTKMTNMDKRINSKLSNLGKSVASHSKTVDSFIDKFTKTSNRYGKLSNDSSEKLQKDLNRLLTTALCPRGGYKYRDDACYKISDKAADWEAARKKCLEKGARLVSIETLKEQAILRVLISETTDTKTTFWTGGNDKGQEGRWVWDGVGTKLTGYTNWGEENSYEGTSLLTEAQRVQLGKLLPKKSFHLLYRASRDGMSASAFHSKCNGKGATISIGLDATTGSVFGGYTSLSWAGGSGVYRSDGNAFLFKLCETGKCTSSRHSQTNYAMYDHSTYGPTFGNGHDLMFFTQTYTFDQNNNYFSTNGYCRHSSYTGTVGCGKNVKWRDVEVYAVKDSDGDCMSLKPTSQEWQTTKCTTNARFICEV